MEKKITKKDYFNLLLTFEEVKENEKLVEFLNHEIELLERKNKRTTPTKVQQENENLKKIILEELSEIAKPVTIKELQTLSTRLNLNLYSNQKISSLVRQLKQEELVTSEIQKGRTYYSIKED